MGMSMNLMRTLGGIAAAIGLTGCNVEGPNNSAQSSIPTSEPDPLVLTVVRGGVAHPQALHQADQLHRFGLASLARNADLRAGLLEVAAATSFNNSLETLGTRAVDFAKRGSLSAEDLEALANTIGDATDALLAYKELAPKTREPEGLTELHVALTKTRLALTQMADTLAGLGASEPNSMLAPAVLRRSVNFVVDDGLQRDLVGLAARVEAVGADVRGSLNEAAMSTVQKMGYNGTDRPF